MYTSASIKPKNTMGDTASCYGDEAKYEQSKYFPQTSHTNSITQTNKQVRIKQQTQRAVQN